MLPVKNQTRKNKNDLPVHRAKSLLHSKHRTMNNQAQIFLAISRKFGKGHFYPLSGCAWV